MYHSIILNNRIKDIAAMHQSLAERDFTSGEHSSRVSATGRVWLFRPFIHFISLAHAALLIYCCEMMLGVANIVIKSPKIQGVKVRSFCQKLAYIITLYMVQNKFKYTFATVNVFQKSK